MASSRLRRYREKPDRFVTAVRLELDTAGFTYRKWGGVQRCKRGDWLVNNDGEVYTVDAKTFAKTYRRLWPGVYVKTTPVWVEVATAEGSVKTKEGRSHYKRGDYIVYNGKARKDGYCMSAVKFKARYKIDSAGKVSS